MSGGRFNYEYSRIQETYENELEHQWLEEFLVDFCKVLKELEWYKSADTCKERYDEAVEKLRNKWFKGKSSSYLLAKSDIIAKTKDFLTSLEKGK